MRSTGASGRTAHARASTTDAAYQRDRCCSASCRCRGSAWPGAEPPARQHDRAARQFGAERGKFGIGKAGGAGKALDPPGRQPGRIIDQCPPAGFYQGGAIDRDREIRLGWRCDGSHGFRPAGDPVQERIALQPGGRPAGKNSGQQQGQRQVGAPNSRKRRAAEHILRRGGETRNIEFSDFAVRAAGEQAGRRVKVPAQRPRPPESFDGGIPVGEYLVAIGEHGAVAHLDQRVMPGSPVSVESPGPHRPRPEPSRTRSRSNRPTPAPAPEAPPVHRLRCRRHSRSDPPGGRTRAARSGARRAPWRRDRTARASRARPRRAVR